MKVLGEISRLINESKIQDVIEDEGKEVDSDAGQEEALDEAVSASKISKLIEAMVYSPRVEAVLSGIGMDENAVLEFKQNLEPAVKLILDKQGFGIAGSAAAKMAVKTMTK